MPESPERAIGSDEHALPLLLHRKSPVPPPDQISVKQLAGELGILPSRVQPLIDHGYLRVMAAGYSADTTIVARPLPAALAWLKSLFAPLRMRPMLPVEDVAEMLNLTPAELRSFVVHYNIPLWDDPVFGELMTINGLRAVQRGIYAERRSTRYDRQTLLEFLCKQSGITWNLTNFSYSMQLDTEIRRICKMPEPGRTVRAVALWTAWRDAQTVTECLTKYRATMKAQEPPKKSAWRKLVDKDMDVIEKGINGELKEWKPPLLKERQNIGNCPERKLKRRFTS